MEEVKTNKPAYVRPVSVAELPQDVQSDLGGIETVYAIFDEMGTQLALVNGQKLAFSVARQNHYEPYLLN